MRVAYKYDFDNFHGKIKFDMIRESLPICRGAHTAAATLSVGLMKGNDDLHKRAFLYLAEASPRCI